MSKTSTTFMTIILPVTIGVTMQGCETIEGSAATFGTIGAAAGALLGDQNGSAVEGAAIGGLVGAGAGLIAHDIRKQRQARHTGAPGVTDSPAKRGGPRVIIENAVVQPGVVQPGGRVFGEMTYTVVDAGAGLTFREQFVLTKNGSVVTPILDNTVTRTNGTFRRSYTLQVPSQAQGNYRIVGVLTGQHATYTANADFAIAADNPQPSRRVEYVRPHHARGK